jgi:hypothetical protein
MESVESLAWDKIYPITTIEQLFDSKYYSITNVIECNSDWTDGMGYFESAVELFKGCEPGAVVNLRPGEMAKSITPDYRKVIFVGTHFGTCAVFQRYTGSSDILGTSQSGLLRKTGLVKDTNKDTNKLEFADLERIVGEAYYNGMPNVGVIIANIVECLDIVRSANR